MSVMITIQKIVYRVKNIGVVISFVYIEKETNLFSCKEPMTSTHAKGKV